MALRANVDGFLAVSKSVSDECEKIAREHGVDPNSLNMADEKQVAAQLAMREAAKPVRQYLAGLGLPDLQEMVALMYAGRDGGTSQDWLARVQAKGDSSEQLVESIATKHVACRAYFEKGLAKTAE